MDSLEKVTSQFLLTVDEAIKFLSVGRTHFYMMAKRPDFPRPVRFGREKCVRYVRDDLVKFVLALQADSHSQ